MRPLQHNPDPLRLVPGAAREAWRRSPDQSHRCFHEDGRGRCRSRETEPLLFEQPGTRVPRVEWYCQKHRP